jgi:molybdopterin molybdotransferase
MSGIEAYQLERAKGILNSDFKKVGDRAQFLKAQLHNGELYVLEGQSSAMLHTFSLANALAYIPEEVEHLRKGDIVEVIKLAEAYGL